MNPKYLHEVTHVKHLEGYTVEVQFDDGTSGQVDFAEWSPFPGVLAPLAQPKIFGTIYVHPEHKTVAWASPAVALDVDPIWLYCRANGIALPDWQTTP